MTFFFENYIEIDLRIFITLRKTFLIMRFIDLRFLAILLFPLFLISCDNEPLPDDFELNDPNSGNGDQNELIGNWEILSYVSDVTITATAEINGQTQSQDSTILTSYNTGNITINFNEDFTYFSSGEGLFDVVTEVDGIEVGSETVQEPFDTTQGSWSSNGNNLILSDSAQDLSIEFTITSLTESTLVLTGVLDEGFLNDIGLPDGFPDTGTTISGSGTLDMTLTKVTDE